MADYKNKPYEVFMEEAVRMLFDLDPESICIQAELADGQIATAYYHMDIGVRARMMGALLTDQIIAVARTKNKIDAVSE